MGRLAKAAAVLAMMTLPMSCVRFELDEGDEADVDVSSSALRVTSEDSVVLCPLAANLESSGNVSIVWAGYPAGDDRLQLMHARVSGQGAMLQEPRGLTLLSDEVTLLSIHSSDAGQEVNAVASDGYQTLRIDLSEGGLVEAVHTDAIAVDDQDGAFEAMSDERCETAVRTENTRLQILRTHVDGELPLFVESFSL